MIEGLLKHNFESFWEINQPLCDKPIANLKKYAIKVFTNIHHTYLQPVADATGSNLEQTIGDVLEEVFPKLFEKVLNDNGDLEILKKRDFEVITHGVEIDVNTPVYWL